MARPTDYSSDILTKARAYLKSYSKLGEVIPSIAGLALALDLSRETLYAWAKDPDKQEFSDILSDCMAQQERTLVNEGLKGVTNPTITKLMLSKHGYSEKQEIEQKGDITIKWE
jgi:DNA-packaging protein gp3